MSGTTTTTIPFAPTQTAPQTFQATLDGVAYNVTITWLFGAGQRNGANWYVNIYDQSGNWVVTLALVGSPDGYDISLTAGYFTTSLVYRISTGNFEISG